jgi:acylglycerol lipase
MTHVDGRLQGAGGTEIYWQAWQPAHAHAVVVLAHGAGEHSGRYAHVGERLAGAGYAVHALDHRGHGRSAGPRMYIDRVDDVVADLGTFIASVRAQYPEVPLVLLGHSMGGLVALRYAIHHQDSIDALVLSGPLAALAAATPLQRMAAQALSAVAPRLGLIAVEPALVSRDPEVVRAYVEDPLVFHGKLPARTIAQLAATVRRFPDEAPAIRVPLLVMLGSADRLVPPEGGRMVHDRAASADKTLIVYDGLYHEILNEPEKDRVMADLVAWLDARYAAQERRTGTSGPQPAQSIATGDGGVTTSA